MGGQRFSVDSVLDGEPDRVLLSHVERVVAATHNLLLTGASGQHPKLIAIVGDGIEKQFPETCGRRAFRMRPDVGAAVPPG